MSDAAPPPAWRATTSKKHPGWLVVIGPYDKQFIEEVKRCIPARAREWVPAIKAWRVLDSYSTSLAAIIEACS